MYTDRSCSDAESMGTPHEAYVDTCCSIITQHAYTHTHTHTLTLDTLGQVPEVEDIVRLGWSGQEVSTHTTIDLNTAAPPHKQEERHSPCVYMYNRGGNYASCINIKYYSAVSLIATCTL